MSTIADLLIKVRADTNGAEKDISSFGSKVGGGFKKALLPATAALGVMGVVGKAAFDNLQDGANNAKQTETVIASTGGAAHVTAKHVDDLAMSLRKKAGVDDDVVHSGENMLLTFTNVQNKAGEGNNIFDQATKTMLDMSHALGQDTKSSAIQLGKALNDPIKGVTALQRVGVSFTATQKKQIKALVDAGNSMDAQKLILHELNKEFGGSAENIDPTTKALANMKLNAVDLASNLLQALLPAMQVVIGIVGKATAFMTDHGEATKIVVGIIAGLALGVIAVNAAMKLYAAGAALVKAATAAWTAVQWLLNAALDANPIGLVVIALAALTAGVILAYTKSETFRNIVTGVFDDVKGAANAVLTFFRDHWPAIATLLSGPFAPIVALATNAFGVRSALGDAGEAMLGWFRNHWPAIATVISGPFAPLVALATNAFGVRDAFSKALDGMKGAAGDAVGTIGDKFHSLTSVIGTVIAWAYKLIGVIESIASKVDSAFGKVGDLLGKAGSLLGHIPGHANGITNSPGGLAIVGERGPELVNLPKGSSVFSNSQSRRMMTGSTPSPGSGGPAVNIEGDLVIREELDFDRAAAMFGRRLAVIS